MEPKHLISIRDLSAKDVSEVFQLTVDLKATPDRFRTSLAGKTLGLFFQSPSTRTRTAFHVAMYQLGGLAIDLNDRDMQTSRGESMADTAKTLSRYLDGIVARMRTHAHLVELSRNAEVPVINGLTDLLHPCQVLGDFLTLIEKKGSLTGRKLAYVGPGNHMCHSLIYGAIKSGMNVAVAAPPGYEPKPLILKSANREASAAGVTISVTDDPAAAVQGADVVYTDAWVSIGQEAEAADRVEALAPYQVNPALMSQAKPDALFMHGLPAHREEEVTKEVIDGPQSVIFEQAENRLHVAKAILIRLLSGV